MKYTIHYYLLGQVVLVIISGFLLMLIHSKESATSTRAQLSPA